MEGVDHVHIVEVGSGCLIGDVHGMFEGQVPYGERFKLGISGTHASAVFMVELAQAHGHLAASRTGRGDDDQGALCLHIVILAESFVRCDERHVVGIPLDEVMAVGLDAVALEALAEGGCGRLAIVVRNDHRAYHEATMLEFSAQAKHVLVISYA